MNLYQLARTTLLVIAKGIRDKEQSKKYTHQSVLQQEFNYFQRDQLMFFNLRISDQPTQLLGPLNIS